MIHRSVAKAKPCSKTLIETLMYRLSYACFLCLTLSTCGGSNYSENRENRTTPSLTPTATPSPSPTVAPSATPTPTPLPTPPPTSSPSPTPTPVAGLRSDFNADNCVGYGDYSLLLENYGLEVNGPREKFDTNNDGIIDFDDYAILLQDWGSGCTASYGPADPLQFTFVAEITNENNEHLCSAAILDADWVLSLAGCIHSLNQSNLRIVTQRANTEDEVITEHVRNIVELAYFPETDAPQNTDLVLIKVNRAFEFGDTTTPIALSTQRINDNPTQQMLGWGILADAVTTSGEPLQYIDTFTADTTDSPCYTELTSTIELSCIRSKDDSFQFKLIDKGAPVIHLAPIDVAPNGLSYRLAGFAAATTNPVSSSAIITSLTASNEQINQWIEATITRTNIYGDINGDGCVNDADYQLYLLNNGRTREEAEPPEADINADGIVSFEDYAILLQQWEQGCSNNAPSE